MSQLAFTLSDMLLFIILSLLVGAFFGRWIAREAKEFLRPSLGESLLRESKERGVQVLRLAGLSNARLIGNELEGTWRRADIVEDESVAPTLRLPEAWTPPPQKDQTSDL